VQTCSKQCMPCLLWLFYMYVQLSSPCAACSAGSCRLLACAMPHPVIHCLCYCCWNLPPQAASFRLSHEKVFTPLVTLAILIQNNPQLASVRKSFPKVAQQLMSSVSVLYGGC
jgi:hypothetical protein